MTYPVTRRRSSRGRGPARPRALCTREGDRLVFHVARRLETPNLWQGRHWRYKDNATKHWENALWHALAYMPGSNEIPMRDIIARRRRMKVTITRLVPSSFRQVVASGKWLPFDGDPVGVRMRQDEETGRVIEDLDAADVHFRSCPRSKDFRRPR